MGFFVFVLFVAMVVGMIWAGTSVGGTSRDMAEVAEWQRETASGRQRRCSRPPPVTTPVVENTHTDLPTPASAHDTVREVLADLTGCIVAEAREYERVLRPPSERLCERGRFRDHLPWGWDDVLDCQEPDPGWGPKQEGTRPTRKTFDRVEDVFAWTNARTALLSGIRHDRIPSHEYLEYLRRTGIHSEAACLLAGTMSPLESTFQEFLFSSAHPWRVDDGAGVPVLAPGRWEEFLREVHTQLTRIRDGLSTLPLPELPLVRAPSQARLKDHVSTEAMRGRLDDFITRTTALREKALTDGWTGPFGDGWSLDGGLLDGFVTDEVRDRFARATAGFTCVAGWTEADVAPASHARIYLAYVAIALNYLTEVRAHLDEYARDSARGGAYNVIAQGSSIGGRGHTVHLTNTFGFNPGEVGQFVRLAALIRQIGPSLGLPETEQTDLMNSAEALARVASADKPEKGALRRAAERVRDALTSASTTTEALPILVTQAHRAYRAVFGG